MKVDKLKEDFFIEISFKSPFVVSLPNEGVLRRKSVYILKSEDISDSFIVFIDVGAIVAPVDEGFIHGFSILSFTASTVPIATCKVRQLSSELCFSIKEF